MLGAIINPSGFARVSELRSLGVPFAVSTIWHKVANITVWKIADVLAWMEEQANPAPANSESRGAKLTASRLAKRQEQAAAHEHDSACAHVSHWARCEA